MFTGLLLIHLPALPPFEYLNSRVPHQPPFVEGQSNLILEILHFFHKDKGNVHKIYSHIVLSLTFQILTFKSFTIYIHIMQIFLSCLKLRAAPFILDKNLLNKEICSWPWSGSGATFFDVAALVAFFKGQLFYAHF